MTNGIDLFEEIRKIIDYMEEDIIFFYDNNNHAAGRRARKQLQVIKAKAQALRVNIQEIKKAAIRE